MNRRNYSPLLRTQTQVARHDRKRGITRRECVQLPEDVRDMVVCLSVLAEEGFTFAIGGNNESMTKVSKWGIREARRNSDNEEDVTKSCVSKRAVYLNMNGRKVT